MLPVAWPLVPEVLPFVKGEAVGFAALAPELEAQGRVKIVSWPALTAESSPLDGYELSPAAAPAPELARRTLT